MDFSSRRVRAVVTLLAQCFDRCVSIDVKLRRLYQKCKAMILHSRHVSFITKSLLQRVKHAKPLAGVIVKQNNLPPKCYSSSSFGGTAYEMNDIRNAHYLLEFKATKV